MTYACGCGARFDRAGGLLNHVREGCDQAGQPVKRNYWPDSSCPNWCPCVEGDPHLCKPELHPTSPVHGAEARDA